MRHDRGSHKAVAVSAEERGRKGKGISRSAAFARVEIYKDQDAEFP
jgi:hypothetical protein